jgi:hypothetical protein
MHKASNEIEHIIVILNEKERLNLADVISRSDKGEEIEIESIVNAFSTVKEIQKTIELAVEKGIVIKTIDGSFSTEDMEDVPAMGYLLNSILELVEDVGTSKAIYPSGFSQVVTGYMDKNITEVEACRTLDIQRTKFYRLLKKFGASRGRCKTKSK